MVLYCIYVLQIMFVTLICLNLDMDSDISYIVVSGCKGLLIFNTRLVLKSQSQFHVWNVVNIILDLSFMEVRCFSE
uniref:Uncharacterized protein n=1 Tax=Rhizophora mucronata TaxID=61149 RepID=A0A2P2P327_RHIMU